MKTITFAITHFTVAFSVAYLLTGSFIVGGLIAVVEPAVNTVAYMIHERIWENKRLQAEGTESVQSRRFATSHFGHSH
ncbi:DUF2061 domain-containing protein [Paraglaciecola polaris]|uniref:Membrane protein-like protein n=1 Tax=Paraglaciecola polaris LMG 21857 TaxID=1129793 RepID=K6ZCU6_9ALTE|nr:DUF2061 domain-containing protein [Paraglaciecola polaris]GAC33901.1 membrane protein-like protein [Paraglaciecola polaris LMG 21857]|tara:strand:- start:970 stop:1203 length:234 start_codon:yes stop_codon:yes gene_type:complete